MLTNQPSVIYWGIHLGSFSKEMFKVFIHGIGLKMTNSIFQQHSPGANEFKCKFFISSSATLKHSWFRKYEFTWYDAMTVLDYFYLGNITLKNGTENIQLDGVGGKTCMYAGTLIARFMGPTWRLVRWFSNDFQSWLHHSWKSLPNLLTHDKKLLFTVTHSSFFISWMKIDS